MTKGRKLQVLLLVVALTLFVGSVTASAEKIVLRVAHAWESTFLDVQKEFDKKFMERYPHIEIRLENFAWENILEKYQTQAAAGTLPDVFYVHCSWAQQFIRQGLLMPLNSYIESTPNFNMDDMFPVGLTPYRANGTLYGLPYDAGPMALFYNKDMFDEAGLPYPTDDWVLDDLLDNAKKLTKDLNGDGRVDQWGISGTLTHETINAPVLAGFGARLVNEDETETLVTTPEAAEAFKWWIALDTEHKVAPSPAQVSAIVEPFTFGRVGMTFGGSWMMERWLRYGTFDADVAHVPAGPAGRYTTVAGSGYGISASTKHAEAAWLYLSEYLSEEGVKFMWGRTGRGSPSRLSAWPDFIQAWEGKNVRVFEEMLNYGLFQRPISPAAPQAFNIINREIELMQLGRKSVEEGLQQIKKEVDAVLAEYTQ